MMQINKLNLNQISQRLHELPTLPTLVHELTQLINDPMSSTSEVENLMQNDPALTTKVLKLVNSAYYAIPGGVSTLSRAIGYLGFDTVHQLVLVTSIISSLKANDSHEFKLTDFWRHSLGVAIAAESIGKFLRHPLTADLFTCGLVHDMGKMALLSLEPESFFHVSHFANENGLSFYEAEINLGWPHHTAIGAALCERWKLPPKIQAVVKNHHQINPDLRGGLTSDLNKTVDIVFLGNLLTHALKFGNSGHKKVLGAPLEILQRLNLDPQLDLKELLFDIKNSLEHVQEFLRVLEGP